MLLSSTPVSTIQIYTNNTTNNITNTQATMADRDSSSTPPLAPTQVELKFKGNNNDEVTFKMKYAMKLKKAMEAYSARVQQPVDQLRFLFEGERLGEDDTPEQVWAPFLTPCVMTSLTDSRYSTRWPTATLLTSIWSRLAAVLLVASRRPTSR